MLGRRTVPPEEGFLTHCLPPGEQDLREEYQDLLMRRRVDGLP